MEALEYLIRLATIGLVSIISYKTRAVDKSGLYAGFIIGSLILLLGGWGMFWLIAYFFVAASIATRYKYDYKRARGVAEDKGGSRSLGNVLGNGLVASLLAILEFLFGGEYWMIAYLGSVSAVTADTLATEIGLLSAKPPRLITRPSKIVEPGSSGGVTLIGFTTALAASISVGLISWLIGIPYNYSLIEVLTISTISGLIGSMFDSILGATIQAQYKCRVCGKISEKKIHCNQATLHVRGFKILDNHVVNLLSSIVGASSAILVAYYLI